MTLYDVLGTGPAASAEELRRAYITAARHAHPDVAGPGGEQRMRDLNAAWKVLGDSRARREYDRSLASSTTDTAVGARPGPTINTPRRTQFVPINAEDEDDDDTWRYVDDVTDPRTAAGPALQFAPVLLVIAGVACAIAGGWLSSKGIFALGLVVAILGFVGFLAAPIIAMGRAKSAETESQRDRH